MSYDITVKARFNATKERVESFGSDKYLMYLPFEEDADAEGILKSILSKHLGVPNSRIELKRITSNKDWVFQVS